LSGRALAILATILLAILTIGFGIACSGGGDGNGQQPSGSSPTAATTATASTPPGVHVETTLETEHYTVLGKTTQEILSYIKDNGPVDGNGDRASGLTRAEWSLEWSRAGIENGCVIRSMTISMDLVILLPQLDTEGLDDRLRANWEAYLANIDVHENRHVDIYLAGADRLKRRMEMLTNQPDCARLEAEVTRIWEDQRAITNEEQDEFHREEEQRIEALREPYGNQIDLNQARLDDLIAEISRLEVIIEDLDSQLETAAPKVEGLSQALKDLEEEYSGVSFPPDIRDQYDSLRSQYVALLPAYNSLVNQYNETVSLRNDLAIEHSALTTETNDLIEVYNWLN
jgi:predicted secreted Zn-dependent protease